MQKFHTKISGVLLKLKEIVQEGMDGSSEEKNVEKRKQYRD